MHSYTVTYWTGEAKTVRAQSLVNAAKASGYSLAYQRRYCASNDEPIFRDGQEHAADTVMDCYGVHGDHCATICQTA